MMHSNPLPRLDLDASVRAALLPHCRLTLGEVWTDPEKRHRVGCMDAANPVHIRTLMGDTTAALAIQDPPYNVAAFKEMPVEQYIEWCEEWIRLTDASLAADSSLYVWMGADQCDSFQPLPDFMVMMRQRPAFRPRSFITMRNQRGFGTQRNWMYVRQELLYYIKGNPCFEVQYTDIPKAVKGYYKVVGGTETENLARGKSESIRAGNVWIDVQQVFYRMQENVSGCYAQKPLKAIERIVHASSQPENLVIDFFAHSGTTLLACERLHRRCYTADIDPVFCEIAIRRLEQYRTTGQVGWQNGNPFEEAGVASELVSGANPEPDLQTSLFLREPHGEAEEATG